MCAVFTFVHENCVGDVFYLVDEPVYVCVWGVGTGGWLGSSGLRSQGRTPLKLLVVVFGVHTTKA